MREGDFAIKLAAELDLGKPENEAVAEDMLAKAGVAPANGWISDYPVTPEIIAQLKDSITKAADNGKIPMKSGEATKGLYYLAEQMNLPVPAGEGSSGTSGAAQTSPTVINNYYYDEGPPIVTYYPPPADYLYLYNWVPFPVFWFGFWFPGFFICHNFTTVVFVTTPFVTTSPVFVTRRAIVSNRIIDPVTRNVAVIDPVVRTSTGVKPVTALRTGNGQMFSTMTDVRRGTSMTGVSAVRANTINGVSPSRSNGGFSSTAARKSAQSIVARDARTMSAGRGTVSGSSRGERHFAAPGAPRRTFSGSPPERTYNSPVMRGSGGPVRGFSAPPARSYTAPVPRGGRDQRWFNGNGWGWHGRG
ncbi:MAG TPA: hypothetical protein VF903_01665 [Nitrospirota bacterium]